MDKITVIGMGFVGEANAYILSKHNHVKIYDINPEVSEKYDYDKTDIYGSDIYIICVPTDGVDGRLDGSIVDKCITDILKNRPCAEIIIRSTVSIGFTDQMRERHCTDKIYFVPEFLREGNNLFDAKNPSRIIAPEKWIADLFLKCSVNNPPVLICSTSEAEAVKLFSNTLLAARVALFNEIDSECIAKHLDACKVIKGICLDSRIGDYYNNPSFGFGGYCLPKDSAEIASTSTGVILKSIPESNEQRKQFIADVIDKRYAGKKIVVTDTSMKTGSSNSKCSAVLDVLQYVKNCEVIKIDDAETSIFNRVDKIFTRDLYNRD